ncbi:hypothetical protein EV121DRAFT_266006, partial [Schizophyllum commune]
VEHVGEPCAHRKGRNRHRLLEGYRRRHCLRAGKARRQSHDHLHFRLEPGPRRRSRCTHRVPQQRLAAASMRADLRLPESPAVIVDATLKAFSTNAIDVLVNNAGVEQNRLLTDVSAEDFNRVFDVNVRGAMLMTRAVIPHLRAPGRIVNISSLGARRGFSGYTVYCASKAALEGFTRALAVELGAAGHSVNAVAPGPTESDMLYTLSEEILETQKKRTPMQNRIGTKDDIAQVVAWLASESSRWVTGQTISATGGIETL